MQQSTLFDALTRCDVDLAKTLLKAGADVNARNEDGFPPLHFCKSQPEYIEFIKLFIAYGAHIDAKAIDSTNGLTAQDWIFACSSHPESGIIQAIDESRFKKDLLLGEVATTDYFSIVDDVRYYNTVVRKGNARFLENLDSVLERPLFLIRRHKTAQLRYLLLQDKALVNKQDAFGATLIFSTEMRCLSRQ